MSNGCTNNGEIIRTYIIDDISSLSGCTLEIDELGSCSSSGITLTDSILPLPDNSIDLGTPLRRFRDINTFSGTSTVWASTQEVITPRLNLGLDGLGNLRIINADNSIIQNDTLLGGTY